MTNRQRDSQEQKAQQAGKGPLPGGRKPPETDQHPEGIRSLLARGRTAEAMELLKDPESMVQLRKLATSKEEDSKVKWRAAKLLVTYCIIKKEWDRVKPLVTSRDQAVREGAISALSDAAADGAHNLAVISGLISDASGNGNGHSLRAAHAMLNVIKGK